MKAKFRRAVAKLQIMILVEQNLLLKEEESEEGNPDSRNKSVKLVMKKIWFGKTSKSATSKLRRKTITTSRRLSMPITTPKITTRRSITTPNFRASMSTKKKIFNRASSMPMD